jgi:FkbM family methyltransferase
MTKMLTTFRNRLGDNAWLIRNCRDMSTVRAMKGYSIGCSKPSMRFRRTMTPVDIRYRPGTSDVAVAWEVFRGGEYAIPGLNRWPFTTVIDGGANVGMFLAYLIGRCGGHLEKYIAVEPDEEAAVLLEENVMRFGLGDRAVTIKAALASQPGAVGFSAEGPSYGHRVTVDGPRRVRAMTVGEIVALSGMQECELLKLDIEGSEYDVLEHASEWSDRVQCVVVELHDEQRGMQWFSTHLERAGYKVFAAGDLFLKQPSAVRLDVWPRLRNEIDLGRTGGRGASLSSRRTRGGYCEGGPGDGT